MADCSAVMPLVTRQYLLQRPPCGHCRHSPCCRFAEQLQAEKRREARKRKQQEAAEEARREFDFEAHWKKAKELEPERERKRAEEEQMRQEARRRALRERRERQRVEEVRQRAEAEQKWAMSIAWQSHGAQCLKPMPCCRYARYQEAQILRARRVTQRRRQLREYKSEHYFSKASIRPILPWIPNDRIASQRLGKCALENALPPSQT